MDKPVSNDRKMDYGDFMILETNLLLDDFNSLITDILRKDEMTLGGYSIKFQKDKMLLPTYSYPWGENFVSSLGSGDIERLGLKWPSKVYVLGLSQSKDIPIIPLQQWVRKDLPLYANIYSAIENEFHITGLSSALYWLGKIIILLPDYRAHFNKLTVFHDSMTVHIEINPEFSEKLLIKYLNESWLGNEHPSAIVAIRRKEFSLPNTDNEINEGQFIGYTRSSDGVSLTFGVVGQNTHYSLSIGKRCHNHMVEFMVWGYAWQDWGNFRLYQGPMTSSFIWPLRLISHKFGKCTKEERELLETIFAEELCNNELLKNEVNQTLDLVLDKLKEVDDKALKSFYLIYKLPSNSSFYWP